LNCPDKTYAKPSAAECEPCPSGSPEAVRTKMEADKIDEIFIEKCISKPTTQYLNFKF